MRRREFIALGSAAATLLPLPIGAQQRALPVVGYFSLLSSRNSIALAPFLRGLSDVGYVEGQNVSVVYRSADGQSDRMPAVAAELVRQQVDVIIATNTSAAIVAKAATSKIPIVFIVGDDPLKFGLVASYNRPGGNATGVNVVAIELEGKRLGILRDVVPAAEMIAALVNPDNANAETQLKDIQDAAHTLGRQVRIFNATTEVEIDEVFTSIAHQRIGALAVAGDTFFISRRNQIVTLAAHYAIPTMYQRREFVEAGGLISYGTDYLIITRQAGIYVGRILKGEKPADLPVMQPTKFELVINLKTAKRLNLDLPATVLALADEVIE